MTSEQLQARVRQVCAEALPVPGGGATRLRHRRLYEIGREDLSLAKLAEAHWDALAILAEAGRRATPGALYAVWASEAPGQPLELRASGSGWQLSGRKPFASGVPLVDRALVTVLRPQPILVEVDVRALGDSLEFDGSVWHTPAFASTQTGAVNFREVRVSVADIVGGENFYLERSGFWMGACGPAACWAGGAAGLLEAALAASRRDVHTLAHLGAMHSDVWALSALVDAAAEQLDRLAGQSAATRALALTFRQAVEQLATDVLRRFARAYGPHPLAMNEAVSRRYMELDLFLRQSHAERDLEDLGRSVS